MLTSRVRAVRGFTRVMSFVAAVLIAVFGLTMIGGNAYATPGKDNAEKYDFYTLSSNITAYFSEAAKPGDGTGLSADEGWTTIAQKASEGGDLLGYGDNDVSNLSGWFISQTTGVSNIVGYDSLMVRDKDSTSANTNSAYSGVLAYAQYGSLLDSLGLDSTSMGLEPHFQNIAFGFVVVVLYLLAGGIDTIFSAVIWLLETLNPFKFFFSAISASSAAMANGMTGGQGVPVWMQSLDTWFSAWYQALVNLSWTVLIPLFIFTFIISSLMWKKGNALGGLKKLVIRMLFLGVGLPLIGSMYTASLGVMKDATAGAGMGATRVVISTFVDFENWAKKDRLAVPDNATLQWDSSKQAPTGDSVNKLRQTTVAINKLANKRAFEDVADIDVSGLGSISTEAAKTDTTSSGGLPADAYVASMQMLLRYTTAQTYQASDFETGIKGRISQQAANGEKAIKGCATTWFNVQSDGSTKKAGGSDCAEPKASNNPVLKVREGSGLEASGESGTITFKTNGDKYAGDWVMLGDDFNGANMSALSMYNYLNTSFSKDFVTIYSSSNVISAATREYHSSVNLVGSAGVSWLYWVNGAVTLLCFIVLGLGYAFGMFTGAIKNSLHIITAVPFATLGSMAGIAKVVIYTFTMITEIIGTMFIYRLVQEIILSVPSIFEGGLEHMFNSMGGFGTYLKNSGNITLFTSLVSIVLLILLTWKMMHFRGAFVKGLNEAVTKIVDKFLDTNVAPPAGGGKLMPALAGGVGAGVGSAAANRLMSGRGSLGSGSGRGGASSGLMAGSGGIQDGNGGVSGMGGGMLSINGTDGPGSDESGPGAPGGDPNGPAGSGSGGGGLLLSDGSGGVNTNVNNDIANNGESFNSLTTSETDRQIAREVDARGGLSEPSASSDSYSGDDVTSSSTVVNNSDDAMSETTSSIQSTMEAHDKADKARVDQATSGVKAAWHGGKAAAKAYSGDVAGAAQDGQKTLSDVQSAQTKGQEAKAHRQSAEAPRPVRSASQPRQMNQPQQSQPQRGVVGAQRPSPAQAQPQQPRHPQAQPQSQQVPAQAPPQVASPAQTPAPSRPAPSRGVSSRSLSAPRQGASQMPSSGKSANGGVKSASGKAGKGLKGMKPSGGSSMPPMPS